MYIVIQLLFPSLNWDGYSIWMNKIVPFFKSKNEKSYMRYATAH